MSKYTVKFAGNDLSLIPNIELYNHEFNSTPDRDIKINKIARRDISIITSSEYTSKLIPVYFDITGGTREATEDSITYLKSLLQGQNESLVVEQGSSDVSYTATMNEFNITWYGVNASVEVIFIASDPIGRTVDAVTFANISGITDASSDASVLVDGSSTAYPEITITITAVTGGSSASVFVGNGRTGQGMTLTRNWVATDVVIIDSLNMTVTINGASSDFTGMFPQFPAGSQQLTYTDTFTTRTVSITSTYKPRLA